jgi:hypothetical protein
MKMEYLGLICGGLTFVAFMMLTPFVLRVVEQQEQRLSENDPPPAGGRQQRSPRPAPSLPVGQPVREPAQPPQPVGQQTQVSQPVINVRRPERAERENPIGGFTPRDRRLIIKTNKKS